RTCLSRSPKQTNKSSCFSTLRIITVRPFAILKTKIQHHPKMKMNKAIAASFALTLLSTLNSQLSTCFAQGSLSPPAPPTPMMKTLAQIEPRTPISSAPFTITDSGSYYLTTNITVNSGNAISIATNNVTLDLNGFTISSTAASPDGSAVVFVSSNPSDVQ